MIKAKSKLGDIIEKNWTTDVPTYNGLSIKGRAEHRGKQAYDFSFIFYIITRFPNPRFVGGHQEDGGVKWLAKR